MQKYSVNQHLIETLLTWVKSGEIAIPEIQRPFVWDSSKVRDLMDSLYQGFPVGYVIAWRNPNVRLKDGSMSEGKKILTNNEVSLEKESIDSVVDSAATVVDDSDSDSEESNKRAARNSVESNVGVNTNKYTVDPFGGITNLEVTFVNNMDYQIDECEIQVDYIQENGSVFKTEYLIINNIPSHQDKTISAPDSNRGLEVNVKINFIKSKRLDLCYSSLEAPAAGDIDPYKCK